MQEPVGLYFDFTLNGPADPSGISVDYAGCWGYWSYEQDMVNGQVWLGMYSNRDFLAGVGSSFDGVEISQCTDGTSNTIFYGETQGEVEDNVRIEAQHYLFAWQGIFINDADDPDSGAWGIDYQPYLNPLQASDGTQHYSIDQFSGTHPGTVNFCFTDGSAHAIDRNTEGPAVLGRLAARADGDVVSHDF